MQKGIADVRGQHWVESIHVLPISQSNTMGNIYLTLSSYFHKINSGRNNNKKLLIGSYLNTYTNPSINKIKHTRVKCFFLFQVKVGASPCAQKKEKKNYGDEKDPFGSETTC